MFLYGYNAGDGQVKATGGHLNLKGEQDQVLNNVSRLNLQEFPSVISSLCLSSDGQFPVAQQNDGTWRFHDGHFASRNIQFALSMSNLF